MLLKKISELGCCQFERACFVDKLLESVTTRKTEQLHRCFKLIQTHPANKSVRRKVKSEGLVLVWVLIDWPRLSLSFLRLILSAAVICWTCVTLWVLSCSRPGWGACRRVQEQSPTTRASYQSEVTWASAITRVRFCSLLVRGLSVSRNLLGTPVWCFGLTSFCPLYVQIMIKVLKPCSVSHEKLFGDLWFLLSKILSGRRESALASVNRISTRSNLPGVICR